MADYLIRYKDLQSQADVLQGIGKTLASFENRLNTVANTMDSRDDSLASLKLQTKSCGKIIPALSNRLAAGADTLTEIRSLFLQSENDVFLSIDTTTIGTPLSTQLSIGIVGGELDGFSMQDIASYLVAGWNTLKKEKKFIGGVDDVLDLLNVFGIGDDDGNPIIKAIKDSGIYKSISYISDAQKLIDAINNKDYSKLDSLAKKYILKPIAKTTYGVTGVTANGYINLGWNTFENLLDLDKFSYATTSKSPIVGFAEYVWHVTGWTLIETGTEMAYNIVEDIGGLFGYDISKQYENAVGVGGMEGVYKAFGQIADEMFGEYYKKGGVGGAIEGTIDMVSDSLGWWSSKITNLFN